MAGNGKFLLSGETVRNIGCLKEEGIKSNMPA
jgi:hypothetical protein